MKKITIAALLIHCMLSMTFAQKNKDVFVKKTDQTITPDGILDEAIWTELTSSANDFTQYFPTDTMPSINPTEIYMCYDETHLYLGIKCYGKRENWTIKSLKRDYQAGGTDNLSIVFDGFKDRTNGYIFGINPHGVLREGVITNGGNNYRDFDLSWDNKWRGDAHIYDDYYTAEMAIPFSALRFIDGSQQWYLSAYRFDTEHNEWSTWTGIPQNLPLMCLAFGGKMNWEEPLKSKRNMAFIPYVSADYQKNYETETPSKVGTAIGGDAKIGITSGLNLDLTINPDFSQVEVDRQITDLSRFEIFFPERRQFFLENADLFGSFGFGNINPFFSRRIGVARNSSGYTVQNQIYAGARLSGKLSENTRIGLLNMQTAPDQTNGILTNNYTVAALQQRVLKRSSLNFIMVNRQAPSTKAQELGLNAYNRVAGVDFNYRNEDNSIYGKTFLHGSWTTGQSNKLPISHGLEISRNKRGLEMTWSHEYVHGDYNAETGFVMRRNYFRINPSIKRTLYPSSVTFNKWDYGIRANFWWKPTLGKTDHTIALNINGQTNGNARLSASLNHEYVYLFRSFDPTGTGSTPLAADSEYNYINANLSYRSDQRKPFNYQLRSYIGQYFNGKRMGLSGEVTFRHEPKLTVSADFNFNYFDMPYLRGGKRTFLIGPRVDYTFSKSLFFTTFLQYNTQTKNTNINSRLQWRFAPVSDFFLVFTDNYDTGAANPEDRFGFRVKNRALVAKLTYWISG